MPPWSRRVSTIACLALLGCSESTAPVSAPLNGTFTATLTVRDTTLHLAGRAQFYYQATDSTLRTFLLDSTGGVFIGDFRSHGGITLIGPRGRPDMGSYPALPQDAVQPGAQAFVPSFYLYSPEIGNGAGAFESLSGTVTIDAPADSLFVAHVDLDGTIVGATAPTHASLHGRFSARIIQP